MQLSRASDFVAALHRKDGTDWTPDTTVTLTVGTLVWTATRDGAYLRFNVDRAVVADLTLPEYVAVLQFTQGAYDVLWAQGKAYVQ